MICVHEQTLQLTVLWDTRLHNIKSLLCKKCVSFLVGKMQPEKQQDYTVIGVINDG